MLINSLYCNQNNLKNIKTQLFGTDILSLNFEEITIY